MNDNLSLTPDAQLTFVMNTLREKDFSGAPASNQHIVPGVFFSMDPESDNSVELESPPGEMLRARLVVDKPGRWLTLNLDVGRADLRGRSIIGFAAKTDAPGTTTCRVCLRSGGPDGVKDVCFPKTLVSFPKTSLHLDILQLDHSDLPERANWRQLVFFFEVVSQTINLRDFRFFIL